MGMTLVSFYANPDGTDYYSRAARRLTSRCVKYGIPHAIHERPDAGSWLRNTTQKPDFIRSMMAELGPVLWVDVDCRLAGDPMPFASEAIREHDVAFAGFRNCDSRSFVATNPLPDNPMQTPLRVMGIAHAWRPTADSKALLDRWHELCQGPWSKRHGDHRLMQHALDELTVAGRIRWTYLPDTLGRGIVQLGLANGVPGRAEAMRRATA